MAPAPSAIVSKLRQNVIITFIVTFIWVILGTLGYSADSAPVNSIAVIWPGAILHGIGGILFGGWGIVATVVSTMIVDAIKVGEPYAIYGFILPSILQSLIPAIYYRGRIKKYGWGKETFAFVPFLFYAVLINNLVGAASGTLMMLLGSSSSGPFWFPFIRWSVANIPISLILGWPLFRCLGPVMAEEGLNVEGWWR